MLTVRATASPQPRVQPAPVHWLTMSDGRAVGYQIDPELVEDFMFRAGLTRASLAIAIRSSKGYVTDILGSVNKETGVRTAPRRQPSEAIIKRLADALDVHPRALLLRAVNANSVSMVPEPASDEPVPA